MTKKEKATLFDEYLKKLYGNVECGLDSGGDPFRLLVMAILSAQCTDVRVNIVSKTLFEKLPDAKAMAESKEGELEELIRSVGLYNSKAKNLRACAKRICDTYDGKVPKEMEDLLTLGGVGRKVANLVRGDIYGLGGIVADTHCIRITHRLGLTTKPDPLTTERELDKLIPKSEQSDFCHRIVMFGRDICTARSPKCDKCEMQSVCKYK
ncbi:MAG: endonuclease III [Clostridia bacterium]|nr:endonuclease III [Clostridia bacterium]MBQ6905954.1 endonuclease III [Clostridia bacterium]